jgi:homogentisate 1,2-dioxygenase
MSELNYLSGFRNHFASEIRQGLLPEGQNSPQRAADGLFAELLSGTSFTSPRHQNLRTWMYRKFPSVVSGPCEAYVPDVKGSQGKGAQIKGAQIKGLQASEERSKWISDASEVLPSAPNPMRWAPFSYPKAALDFVDGLFTLAVNGSPQGQLGIAIHMYFARRSMDRRALRNSDGEMLIVPQEGALLVTTECGRLEVCPGEIVVIPRGMVFKVDLKEKQARGYVCENFGSAFQLPELGPIGSNGLANTRDFLSPVAWVEPELGKAVSTYQLIRKSAGLLWSSEQRTSPFNVAAWHGNLAPYKYDTAKFMVLGSISFDHPDPSIFTVLTSVSDTPGTANCDFVIFPPRWLVAERTFRPPWYHRNVMSEFMGLIHGQYDAKAEGFRPGGASLHNSMVPHGPDAEAFTKASAAHLSPQKLDNTLAIMFESRYLMRATPFALGHSGLERDYWKCWAELKPQVVR